MERKKSDKNLKRFAVSFLTLVLVLTASLLPIGGVNGQNVVYAAESTDEVTLTAVLNPINDPTTERVELTIGVDNSAKKVALSGVQFYIEYPEVFKLVEKNVAKNEGSFFRNNVSFFGETDANPYFCGFGSHEEDTKSESTNQESGKLATFVFEAQSMLNRETAYKFKICDGTETSLQGKEGAPKAFCLATPQEGTPETTYYKVVLPANACTYQNKNITDEILSVDSENKTTIEPPPASGSKVTVKKQAIADAVKDGKDAVINMTAVGNAEGSSLEISKDAMGLVGDTQNSSLTLQTPAGNLSFSKDAAKGINKSKGGERLLISVSKKDEIKYTPKGQPEVTAAAVDFEVTAKLHNGTGNEPTEIKDFGKGEVTVALPLPNSLKDYNDEDIKCWYYTAKNFVPVDGQVINVDGTRQFVFTTTHFSTFMATTETIFNDYAAAEGLSPGITLSGKVKSYNPKNELSITLKDAENNTIQATTISTPTETSGLTTQDFTFTGVAPGTYDLVVQKDGHLDYTIKSVVVGEKDIDLTQMTGKAYQTITLLAGDVNGDGKIFANDFKLIRENLMKTGSAISDTRADINGDGKVFANDFTPVRTNLMKTAANCSFSYI